MRRLVAALIAAMLVAGAVTLTGCGGGEEESPPPPPGETSPGSDASESGDQESAPASAVEATGAASTADTKAPLDLTGIRFPDDPDKVPEEILVRLDADQPMLVYFYSTDELVEDDLSSEVESVVAEYRGAIDRIEFELSEDSMFTGGGESAVPIDEDTPMGRMYLLADTLNIRETPVILIVDQDGVITYSNLGYVDSAILEREVLDVTR